MMSGGSRRVVFATGAGSALAQVQYHLLFVCTLIRHAKVKSVGLAHLDIFAYVAVEHKLIFDDWRARFARTRARIYMKFQVLRFHFFHPCI